MPRVVAGAWGIDVSGVPAQHRAAEEWRDEHGIWHVRCECNHVSSRPVIGSARVVHARHLLEARKEREGRG